MTMQAPAKPVTVQGNLADLPAIWWPYQKKRVWVTWRWVYKNGKWTKPPFRADGGGHASSTDPATWCSYEEAVAAVEAGRADGIGIAIKGLDGKEIVYDIDDCRDPETGKISSWAQGILDEANSYAEVTPSGTGVRVLGHGEAGNQHRKFNGVDGLDGGLEIYTAGQSRYITITGLQVPGCWPMVSDTTGLTLKLVANNGRMEPEQGDLGPPWEEAPPKPEPAPAYQPKQGSLASVLGLRPSPADELADLICDGAPEGRRSEQFHHAVGLAKQLDWTPQSLEEAMRQYPNGIAHKYLVPHDRLMREIMRCWGKVEGANETFTNANVSILPAAEKPTATPDRFQWLTSSTGLTPVLNGNWLIKHVLPAEGLGVIFGRPGSGKTFSVMDIAMHVAAGIKWRGKKVRRAAVSYVSPEAGRLGVNRVIGWSRHHGIKWPEGFRLSPASINLCSTADDAEALIADIKANQPGCRLVVIDTLNRAMAGGDENSGEDMGRFVALCDHIAKQLQAFVLVVHHSGKDAAKGSRGHSSLLGAVSLELEVTKEQGQPGTIKVTKMRDGEDGAEYGFNIESVPLGEDEDGEEVTTGISIEADAEEARAVKEAKPKGDIQRKLAEAFDQYVDDHGKPNPAGTGFAEPGRVKVVGEEAFLDFAAGKLVGGEKRKRARQGIGGLVNKGYFVVNGGYIWRAK